MHILAKVKRTVMNEDGRYVEKKEQYLVDAMSLSETIENVYKHFDGQDGIDINLVGPENYNDIKDSEGEYFYKVKCWIVDLDEKTGKEKKSSYYLLVQANDLYEAVAKTKEYISTFVVDIFLASVTETKIVDYITPNKA